MTFYSCVCQCVPIYVYVCVGVVCLNYGVSCRTLYQAVDKLEPCWVRSSEKATYGNLQPQTMAHGSQRRGVRPITSRGRHAAEIGEYSMYSMSACDLYMTLLLFFFFSLAVFLFFTDLVRAAEGACMSEVGLYACKLNTQVFASGKFRNLLL